MKYLYTLISLLCLGAFLFYGHKSPVGKLPPVVDFMNPYTGWWQQAERPRLARRFFTGPIDKDVQIIFDDNLVPHIYAENYKDAVYAQGILHAHFRLWQMDITHRATSGRLSEIVGDRALSADEEKRRMGLRTLGDHLIQQAIKDTETRELLNTYTEGVNHLVNQLSPSAYPLEYKLLRYKPELWSLSHTGSVAASLVHNLCFRNEDLDNTKIIQTFGDAFFEKYYPAWNPKQTPIIQEHDKESHWMPKKAGTLSRPVSPAFEQPDPSNGSNNWAVHHSHTQNDNNLLANDPHLGLSLPSLWYELHIHLPNRQIYGVSFPGIPGIVLGLNDQIAWGSTNVSHDVADWVNPIWKDTSSWTYFYEGQWLEAELEEEIIYVRDQDSVVLNIPNTKLGRIPYPESDHELNRMAFYWGPLESEKANLFKTFMGFNRAGSYSEFRAALQYFTFPAQNFVFADRKDTVAMHVQGNLPRRTQGMGIFVQDSVTEAIFASTLHQQNLPHEVNPKRGFVSSANQHSTYPEFPYAYQGFFDDFRGRTLDSMLHSSDQFNFGDMKNIQLSSFSLEAKEALPVLIEHLDLGKKPEPDILGVLRSWNYLYEAESHEATFFTLWWNKVQEHLYGHLDISKKPDSWVLIQLMANQPNDTLFYMHPDSSLHGLRNVVSHSYKEAEIEFDQLDEKAWYAFKATFIPHLANISPFSSSTLKNGGTRNALNSVKKSHGPSWRMVVEMGDSIRAEGIYPGGQSGNPGSYFYDNFVEEWENGRYHPLLMPDIDHWQKRVTKWEVKSK